MIKRFILTILFVAIFSNLIMILRFDADYTDLLHILDALFVVGIIVFFLGLIFITNAFEVLRSTGYAVRLFFSSRLKRQYNSYYAYYLEHKKDADKTTGIPMLVVGGLIVLVVIIISYQYYL